MLPEIAVHSMDTSPASKLGQARSRESRFMHTTYGRRRTDVLDYMQAMLGQLRIMAQAERCDMLAYLIEMAYIEAGDIIRGDRPMQVRGPAPLRDPAQAPDPVKARETSQVRETAPIRDRREDRTD